MRPHPDPLRVYAHAVSEGDGRLARLIAERLFPWVRRRVDPDNAPPCAARAVEQLGKRLGL
jgi:hypothetical protein